VKSIFVSFRKNALKKKKSCCSIKRTKFSSLNNRNYIFDQESKEAFVDNLARPDF
jgi:hypothetical protein